MGREKVILSVFQVFFITSIAVRKEKHNTWTHGLLWSISMHAKVPGGCRLQFKQIARDVQCRKPSSKDDIMRSSWFYCYSNCDKLDLTVCNCFNFVSKRKLFLPFQLISFVVLICYVQTLSFVKSFGYGQETDQLTFKLKQVGKLENSGLMRYRLSLH